MKELAHRNPEPDVSMPSCLPSEAREKWWDIASECSIKNPNSRPSMKEVHERLTDLAEYIAGIHCFLFIYLDTC